MRSMIVSIEWLSTVLYSRRLSEVEAFNLVVCNLTVCQVTVCCVLHQQGVQSALVAWKGRGAEYSHVKVPTASLNVVPEGGPNEPRLALRYTETRLRL